MNRPSLLLNDGSPAPPTLCVYMNLGTLLDLPAKSAWRAADAASGYRQLQSDGFDGLQLITDDPVPPGLALPWCGLDRINAPCEADAIAAKHVARCDSCITVHVGWGIEDDDAVFRLVESVLTASQKHRIPIFIETHRATITQDLWRTVQITRRFPEIRFNGDFSHYYCGQELVYGDWNEKLAFMVPLFERTGFLHGRIASSGCMQVPIDADLTARPLQAHGVANYLEHFRDLWVRAMIGFLRGAGPGDVLIFAPELLSGTYYYARLFPGPSGSLMEESDRYQQALLYKKLAQACWAEAQLRVHSND